MYLATAADHLDNPLRWQINFGQDFPTLHFGLDADQLIRVKVGSCVWFRLDRRRWFLLTDLECQVGRDEFTLLVPRLDMEMDVRAYAPDFSVIWASTVNR